MNKKYGNRTPYNTDSNKNHFEYGAPPHIVAYNPYYYSPPNYITPS